MNVIRNLPVFLLAGGFMGIFCPSAPAQTNQDPIAVARSVIKADRQAAVEQSLQLTDAEAKGFWPLYKKYRAAMDGINDGLEQVVREYAGYYPDVPEDTARKLLKDILSLEKKQTATRAEYLNEFADILPASKALRFAQVENRLDLAARLEIASAIPLLPIQGEIAPRMAAVVTASPGVPGGTAVQVVEITATVIAIDSTNRSLTLLGDDGIKETIEVSPDVDNFDQISVGDTLRVKATLGLVVRMADAGEPAGDDGAAGMVARTPEGAAPGGVVAATVKATATITAINEADRTATLLFDNGTVRTFPVRPDVDLSKRQVGEKVVFRVTRMIAVSIQKSQPRLNERAPGKTVIL